MKTSSQRLPGAPLLAAVFATNQRGQPAFAGIEKSASLNSSAECAGFPDGLFTRPAFSLAASMAASGPATRSASAERSYVASALL